MRAAIYTRISKDLRDNAGVARQESLCRELCERNGWEVEAVYTDNDISAYGGKKRPGYLKMLDDIRAGHIDVVAAWHTDRIYRRLSDLSTFIDVCKDHNVQVATVEGGDIDLSTAAGRMIAGILGAVAAGEVDHQIERQRAAHADRAARGRYRGGPVTFGFKLVPGKPGYLEHDEPRAQAIREAADAILAGKSLRSIARKWVESGIAAESQSMGRFGAAKVRKRLSSPRIAGLESYKGELYPATTYEAIIPEAKWRAVMDVLENKTTNNARGQERKHLGTGIFKCGICGGNMHSIKRAGQSEEYRRYTCARCQRVSRKMKPVDDLVTEVVVGYLAREQLSLTRRDTEDGVNLQALLDEQAEIAARLNELTVMFTDGELTAEQLRIGSRKLTERSEAVAREIDRAQHSSPLAAILLDEDGVRASWDKLNPLQRSKIVDEVCTVTIMPTQARGYFEERDIRIEFK